MSSPREHVESKYMPGVSGRPDIIERWDVIARENGIKAEQWIIFLRSLGVKAAHPDDGWVNRDENYVDFCYPQFNDKPKVGDLICLGSAHNEKSRIVQVVHKRREGIIQRSTKYYFKELSKGES